MSLPSSLSNNTATSSTTLSTPLQSCLVAEAEEYLLDSTVVSKLPTLDDGNTVGNDSDTNANTTDGSDPVVYAGIFACIEQKT